MKSMMLAGVALLGFGGVLTGAAIAQDTSAQPPANSMQATPSTTAPAADPNAGQPTGAVPADTGMAPAPADAPKDPAAPVGSAANPVTVGGNVTPPPAEAKDYPLCSKTVQDSCINPSEAKGHKSRKRR